MKPIIEPTRTQLTDENLNPGQGSALVAAMAEARRPDIVDDAQAQSLVLDTLTIALDLDLYLGTKSGISCDGRRVSWVEIIQCALDEHRPERWASWIHHQLFSRPLPLSDGEKTWADIRPSAIYGATRDSLVVFNKGDGAVRVYQRGTRKLVVEIPGVTAENFYAKVEDLPVSVTSWRLML